MNNVSGVQEVDCTEHVVHECLHVLLCELGRVHICEDCSQVLVKMLHHDEDVGELLVFRLARYNYIH